MASETSLARQLKKLAVPQTTVLIQDKIRKSLLFDHRDAAGLDREVIFAFGTTGLQKLCAINPLFSKFENDLFSVSYKDFQRSVQNTSVNEKLDSKIIEFLRMLSPYFLLREAHESLEWLIYRFNIHLYNVDDLVASVLPHHNTSTFVRVVQLLDLDEGSRWFWLKSIQKTGVHLEYSAVVNRFISDGGFRKLVCDIAPSVIKVFKDHESAAIPVISFSMITIYNALEKCDKVNDKFANSLFPYFLNGLSTGLKKYIAASYMVVCKMMTKVKLNFEILEEFLEKIFASITEDLETEACSVLIVAYQTQTMQRLPRKVFSVLLRNNFCASTLFNLLNEMKSVPLKKAITKKSINSFNKGNSLLAIDFFQKFLDNVTLDSKCVTFCFNFMVKKIIQESQDNDNVEAECRPMAKASKYVFLNLESKYPEYFDTAYKSYVESSDENEAFICNLINKWILNTKYEIVPNASTSLALGLYHANPEVRKTSISYLIQQIQDKNITDKNFAENSLYDRLLDDNPAVVLEILSSLNVVLQVMSKEKLLIAFENLLTKQIRLNSKWYKVQMKCLDIVIMLFKDNQNVFAIFDLILNFLFPVSEHTLDGFIHLLNSDLENNFFKELQNNSNLGKGDTSNDDIIYINQVIIAALKKVIGQMTEKSKVGYASFLNTKIRDFKSNSVLIFYIYAMQFMIQTSTKLENCVEFIDSFLQVLKSYFSQPNIGLEKFKSLSDQDLIKNSIECILSNKIPSSLLYDSLYKIISGLKLELEMKFKSWLCADLEREPSYVIISNLFNFCVIFLNSDKLLLQEYFKKMLSLLISYHFKDIQGTFWFLATKLLNTSENFLVHYTAVNVAITFSQSTDQLSWLFESPIIFFSIFKTIANPEPKLSHAALTLLSLGVKANSKNALKFLADEIVEKCDEIKIDYRQCLSCVGNWLKPAVEHKDGKKTARVSKDLQNKIQVLDQILNLLKEKEVPFCIKHLLLSCFVKLDSKTVLSSCIPILNYHMELLKECLNKEDVLNIVKLLIEKFSPKTAVHLTENSDELKTLLQCLNFTENNADGKVQEFALEILNLDFFSALPSEKIQRDIFENLLVIYMTSPFNVVSKVEKALAGLCQYAYTFIKHLQEKESTVSASTTLREAKKMKKENDSNNDSWKKITILLELIQNEHNFLKKEILIPELFNLLHKSINCEGESTIEYIKQLILSAIYNCYEQLSANEETIMESDFRVEMITLCIRTSTNPKTHHQALLLLNLAASLFPDKVLENIMSIFVFMGSNLVRQDNCYSFQVLSQIIETIMPSLLEASNQQTKTDGFQVVASVIRVFVDSLLDIPGHRQLPLFTKVINTLDPSKYLWLPLAQICDQYAATFSDIAAIEKDQRKISPTLEFAISFHQQFSPGIQIDTCISLVKFLMMLPDSKKQLETNPNDFKKIKEPFNVEAHSDEQLQIYKQNVLNYIKIWLTSPMFYTQVAELSEKEQKNLEEKYEQLLETVLGFLQNRLNLKKSTEDDIKIVNQVQVLYDLVHAVSSILPSQLFIRVMRQLLKNNETEVRLRAIELLNTKLEQLKEITLDETKASLLKLLKPLLKIVDNCLVEENKDDKNVTVQQNSLYSLHLLCKLLGSDFPAKFFKVLKVSVAILVQYHRPELTVNALLCIAQLCRCLNVDILPHLNSFMPTIISILQDKKILDLNECLMLGIVSALNSIIENLGIFLSSYIKDIILNISLYSECNKKAISEKFSKLQTKVAEEIPLRVLINVVLECYSKLCKEDSNSVMALMNILTQSLNATKYDDILSCASELQNIFITLLDFRNCNSLLPAESVNSVENSILLSLKTFVMKLSVTRFRTYFQKIYQWATTSNDDEEQKFRIFTFYKMTCEFSKSLKSLFSGMSRYFFNHISTIFSICNYSKSEVHYFEDDAELSHELLINAVDTLSYCFMYSEEQLLDKENFDTLMQPLVDHIENLHDEVMYQKLIEHHLSSCIAYFMSAISDRSLLRSLNYQIMLKTRNDSPKIRFGVLQVILEVVNKMGENYHELLPESVAFLYELMEDESTEVEQECQTLITEMKRIFGDDIMSYFK